MSKYQRKPFRLMVTCFVKVLHSIRKHGLPRLIWAVIGVVLILMLHGQTTVGASRTITMARPTWDTGWFQGEVYRELLNQLGYPVSNLRTLDNDQFYAQAAEGTVDLWASGWFPLHTRYLTQETVNGQVEPIGFQVPGGAIQGYMVDKATAERLNITTLADLSKPGVAAAFDRTGNGKADLVGCNANWACAEVIQYHLKEYGLENTVEYLEGDYIPMMEEAITHYRRGESILFYTWTPNWTISQLIPGQDVVWLEVPYSSLPPDQQTLESETVITGIEGCVDDPCNIGFPRNDIRVVANTAFLEANPAVRSLLEQVTIPLGDIADQNARMIAGEDTEADIRRHAREWIEANRSQVNEWLAKAQSMKTDSFTTPNIPDTLPNHRSLTIQTPLQVVTKRLEPFVIYENQQYQGFSIDIWNAITQELDVSYELVGVNSFAKLLDDVKRGAADVAIAGIGITSQGEETLDFSHPYYESGLQVLVHSQGGGRGQFFSFVRAVLRSPNLYFGIGIFVLTLLIVAHVLWFSERHHNAQFPSKYFQGIWEAFWWAAVTVTTVGYGDKVPQRFTGRLFALFWMFSGYFVFAYFTASIATTFTVQELQGQINSIDDLPGKRVATVANSAAAEYLDVQTNLIFRDYPTYEETINALKADEVDAMIYDAPVLQYFVSHEGQGQYHIVGDVFKTINYGIALQQNSPYREPINAALLRIYEAGQYNEIYEKWFG